ncbi:hypothetical protein DB31_0224 [Hyalangium minutum]|uniref:Uncharacterized protein n=1 Tax=Hyalangium minutum TaxID=394096 RepID=A0A085WWA0_9BACT|nr:hypothetical protein DB31_0224 [Hyalangium minutum]
MSRQARGGREGCRKCHARAPYYSQVPRAFSWTGTRQVS